MKRKLVIVSAAVFIIAVLSALTVSANGISLSPVGPADVELICSDVEVVLNTEISGDYDEGTLTYIWREVDEMGNPLSFSEESILSDKHFLYIGKVDVSDMGRRRYYLATATAVQNGESVFSQVLYSVVLLPVGFEYGDEEYTEKIEITKVPDKLEYKVGETIDISGLTVKYISNLGNYFESQDINNLIVSPSVAVSEGKMTVTVFDNFLRDSYEITVVSAGDGKTEDTVLESESSENTAVTGDETDTGKTDVTSVTGSADSSGSDAAETSDGFDFSSVNIRTVVLFTIIGLGLVLIFLIVVTVLVVRAKNRKK